MFGKFKQSLFQGRYNGSPATLPIKIRLGNTLTLENKPAGGIFLSRSNFLILAV